MKPNILYTIIKPPIDRPNYHLAYQKAIEGAGGHLLILSPESSREEIGQSVKNADGFLIPGGKDIDPSLYGQKAEKYTKESDEERDNLEIEIVRTAISSSKPILGICKGLQIMNVALGGSLYQDVKEEMPDALNHLGLGDDRSKLIHDVTIKKGSLLEKILGVTTIGVNSLHHQGIRKVSDKLTAVAWASDGLIEGVELTGHPFFLGVQWHPEELQSSEIWKKLFESFVRSCMQ